MEACKEVSCFAPLALAVFDGHRIFWSRPRGRQLPTSSNLTDRLPCRIFNMADEDVATKAPESDVKEPSMISSEDTPAQKGASMGVCCEAPWIELSLI